MNFNRWTNSENRSLALRQFEQDHKRMNDIYWHSVSEKSFFDHQYRQAKKKGNILPYDILKLDPSKPNTKKISNVLETWNSHRKALATWVRLNSLLSIYSYFELYINRVTKTAQESDPGVFLGASKSVDGVRILKKTDWASTHLPNFLAETTKGTWPQRIKAIEEIFGIELKNARLKINDLEKSRKIRNAIAHYFARDLDGVNVHDFSKSNEISLSENKLLEYLGLLSSVAIEVDKAILPMIGEYELIYYYHRYRKDNAKPSGPELKKHLNKMGMWAGKGHKFVTDLIDYYELLT